MIKIPLGERTRLRFQHGMCLHDVMVLLLETLILVATHQININQFMRVLLSSRRVTVTFFVCVLLCMCFLSLLLV